jgi:hypothetical protein
MLEDSFPRCGTQLDPTLQYHYLCGKFMRKPPVSLDCRAGLFAPTQISREVARSHQRGWLGVTPKVGSARRRTAELRRWTNRAPIGNCWLHALEMDQWSPPTTDRFKLPEGRNHSYYMIIWACCFPIRLRVTAMAAQSFALPPIGELPSVVWHMRWKTCREGKDSRDRRCCFLASLQAHLSAAPGSVAF